MNTIKNQLKRAFTIVELVIVIAVIAALAAVLIPTFVNVVNSANESVDTSLVKNLNTALASEEILHGDKASTMSEALEWVEDNGYKVENLTPTSSGDIVWDQDSNRFLLLDEEYNIAYQDGTTSESITDTKYKLWYIAQSETDVAKGTYSYYINYATTSVSVKYGVDVGNYENVDVTITSDVEATIIVNTNGGTLTVNAASYDVSSYGTATNVTITAVSMTSFHVYGEVEGTVTLKAGHLDLKSSSTVKSVYVDYEGDDYLNKVKVTNSSSNKIQISAQKNEVAAGVAKDVDNATALQIDSTLRGYFNGGLGTEANPFLISTSQQFSNIYYVSENASKYGYDSTNQVYYKLTNSIELTTGYSSISVTLFSGFYGDSYGGRLYYAILDGGGYTVTPSTVTAEDGTTTTYPNLFTQVQYCEINNLEVNMLNNNARTVAFSCSGETSFTNVNVSGRVTFTDRNCAVYIGYTYADVTLNNCTNSAVINGQGGTDGYDAIFIAYCQNGKTYTYTFNNCTNEGSLTCGKAAMFIANLCSAENSITLIVNSCKNSGVIRSTYIDTKFTPDYYIASGGVYKNGKCIVDGATYTSATAVPALNNVYNEPDDVATISLNDAGYFVITKSNISGATKYIISFGLYTNVYSEYGGGTDIYHVTLTLSEEDFDENGAYTSVLKNLRFMDLAYYIEKTGDTTLSNATAIGDNAYTVTYDGETYYLVDNDHCYFTNGISSATIFKLSIYDDEGNLLSSPSM